MRLAQTIAIWVLWILEILLFITRIFYSGGSIARMLIDYLYDPLFWVVTALLIWLMVLAKRDAAKQHERNP